MSSAKSTNGGANWRVLTNWLAQFGLPYVHADHHAAAIATIKGKPILLFGGDGGLFTSDDGGATFSSQKNDGMSSYLIYAMTGNPKHKDDVLIGLQDNGTRWRVGPTGTYNQVFGGDGFGVGWSQAQDEISLGSVYYSYIIRNRRNPPNTQSKWEVGYNGIAEFFNPATTYFNTSIATPRASADPGGLTFFHRTRFKLYRTTDGAASWQSVLNTGAVLLRAGSHPIGISPDDLNHFGVLGNGGNLWFTADGGATFQNKVLTAVAPGWPGFNASLAYASNNTMYVGNEAPIGTAQRVIKSTDGGNTWIARQRRVAGGADLEAARQHARRVGQDGVCGDVDWRLRDDRRRRVVAPVWLGPADRQRERSLHADRRQLPARVDVWSRRVGDEVLGIRDQDRDRGTARCRSVRAGSGCRGSRRSAR